MLSEMKKAIFLGLLVTTLPYGAIAQGAGQVNIPLGGTYVANGESIVVTGDNTSAYILNGTGTLNFVGGANTVSTSGSNSHGIFLSKNTANAINLSNAASLDIVVVNNGTSGSSGILSNDKTSSTRPVAPYMINAKNNSIMNINVTNTALAADKYGWGISVGAQNLPSGGAYSGNMASMLITDNSKVNIVTSGNRTGGILNQNTHNFYITVTGNGELNITTNGDNSVGFYSDSNFNAANRLLRNQVNVAGNGKLNITTKGAHSNGIVSLNSSFTAAENSVVDIKTEGNYSHGIVASSGISNPAINYLVGDSQVTIETKGSAAYGLYSTKGGTNMISGSSNVTISTSGSKAYGLYADEGGVGHIGGNAVVDVTTTGSSQTFVLAVDNASLILGDNSVTTIHAQGHDGDGIHFTNGGTVSLEDSATLNINASGNYADAISNQNATAGTFTSAAGTNINISITGDNAEGIFLQNQGNTVYLEGNININNTGNGHGVYIGSDDTVVLNGATIIHMSAASAEALYVDSSVNLGTIRVNGLGGKLVDITGDIGYAGTAASLIEVNLDNANAALTGQILGDFTSAGKAVLNISNQGVWHATNETAGLSRVDELNLSNNGLVDMTHTGVGKYGSITIDKLSGSDGVFKLNTDLEKTKTAGNKDVLTDSDVVNIVGNSTGNHLIAVKDVSLETLREVSGYLLLVHDTSANKEATFTGQDLENGGIFKYKADITDVKPDPNYNYNNVPTDGRNWYLTSIYRDEELTDNAVTNIGVSEARFETYRNERSEQDSLLKRLGELRFNGEDEGLWARVKKNKFNGTGVGLRGGSAITYQVGYDKKFTSPGNAVRHIGAAVGHTQSTTELRTAANLTGSTTTLTVYDTWHGSKGHYLDLVAKAGRMGSDFQLEGTNPETGDSSSFFYNVSGEYGRKIASSQNGWYYEPRVQLGMGRVGSDSYTSSQGTNVYFNQINSLVGRLGVNLGREFGPKENPSKVYGKLSWSHEFGGDVGWSLADKNGDALSDITTYGGSWWTIGLGTALKLANKTYVYTDIEKDFGGKINNEWQINAGLRFAF